MHFEVLSRLFGVTAPLDLTPVSHLRVVKSEAEIKGMEKALRLESTALVALYADLENRLVAKGESIREHEVPPILDHFRGMVAKEEFTVMGGMNSFPMILGSGQNGAIVHYRAEAPNSSIIDPH